MIFGCIWLISFGRGALVPTVLYLILIYFFGAIYLAHLNFYFVALSYVIVYIGAIAILFLFIIMICGDSGSKSPTTPPLVAASLLPLSFIPHSGSFAAVIWHENIVLTELLDINSLSIVMFNGWPVITALLVGILLTSCLIGILEINGFEGE